MSLRIAHIVETSAPRAGQIHAHLGGLVTALTAVDVAGEIIAADDPTAVPDALNRADVIHVHGTAAANSATLSGHDAPTQPMIIAPHGDLLPSPWRRSGPLKRLWAWLRGAGRAYRQAAALHATTPTEADHLRRGGFNDRVEHIDAAATCDDGPGEAIERTVPCAADHRCVLYLGPLHPVEGLVPLLKACEQVVLAAPDWHLIIAGHQQGRWLGMIRAAVERRRLTNRITFVVDPTASQQRGLLAGCEVVCQPNLLEVTPFSALAGLQVGTPCVLSARCYLPDFDDAHGGWRVEPKREALSEALIGVVGNSTDDHRVLGAAGKAWASAHRSWDKLASEYKALYLSVAR